MNNVELIETELGIVPVIITEVIENGKTRYDGRMFDSDIQIFIQTATKESCLIGLRDSFELAVHFWLCTQLTPLNIDLRNG